MTTVASGAWVGLPISIPSASGSMPPIVANVVIKIGRKRNGPAVINASRTSAPSSRNCRVNSMTKIEFFTAMPTCINEPMNAVSPNARCTPG